MGQIVKLPDNIVGKEDRERLESFGGHTIARGRATRWHWSKNDGGDDIFEIYRGGEDDLLAVRVRRDRDRDVFLALDAAEGVVASGTLEHVFARLERHFAHLHGEIPNGPE